MLRRFFVPLVALALMGVAPFAHAQSAFFPNNATINYAIPQNAVVGYANQNDYSNGTNPTSPIIYLIEGGSIGNILIVRNSSTVNLSGGSIGGNLSAYNTSTVNISGGSVGNNLVALDSSTVNVSGSSFGNLFAENAGVFNIFGRDLVAQLKSTNFFGSTRYSLSGTLVDGTVMSNKNLLIQNGTGARFTLNNVPAPGSLMTALIGVIPGVLLLRRRRK